MNRFFRLLFLMLPLSLTACHFGNSAPKKNQAKTVIVKNNQRSSTLTFSGNLYPFKSTNVTAPVAGTIVDRFFRYGQPIKKGEPLFSISSSKQHQVFESALTAYLKAKSAFVRTKTSLKNATFLYKHELISKDKYAQTQNTYYLDQLSLLQAELALHKTLKHDAITKHVFSLKVSDIKNITQTLESAQTVDRIKIKAPVDGVALFPMKETGANEKKANVGLPVKKDQLLLTIGEAQGLRLDVSVDEINVNKLYIGAPAVVTTVALPNVKLNGRVIAIDSQASTRGNLPTFNLTIFIPALSPKNQHKIRIGMSAKATVSIHSKNAIRIPLAAVFQKKGKTYVNVKDKKTKQVKQTPVKTGETGLSSVVVTSGLNPGDHIVYAAH
jgi:HlyD family secretion protein